LGATGAAAQQLDGQWRVRYEPPVTMSHGEATPPKEVRAQITLRQLRDSVFGAWQYSSLPGETPALANELRGTVHRDTVSVTVLPAVDPDAGAFTTSGETIVEWIRKNVHGISPTVTVLNFIVRGDSLIGVRRIVAVDGSVRDRVDPLTGTRIKP
ncbi:MAG: hypothetical protein M3Y64_08980, partial [Gemmatimonadota bacterium]|nr:hypothetical protein [Gemmatimonadota bacterium]